MSVHNYIQMLMLFFEIELHSGLLGIKFFLAGFQFVFQELLLISCHLQLGSTWNIWHINKSPADEFGILLAFRHYLILRFIGFIWNIFSDILWCFAVTTISIEKSKCMYLWKAVIGKTNYTVQRYHNKYVLKRRVNVIHSMSTLLKMGFMLQCVTCILGFYLYETRCEKTL